MTTSEQVLRSYLREPTVNQRLEALRAPSKRHFIAAVAFNYALIALAIGAAAAVSGAFDSVWITGLSAAVAIVLIAARQHALLVLMHEGAHRSISRNRTVNDVLSDLLCGAPLLVSTRSYRRAHMAHHQHLNSASDPDWCRKVDAKAERSQWLFPAQAPLWRLLMQLYGHSVVYLLKSLADNQRSEAAPSETPCDSAHGTRQKALSDRTLASLRYLLYAAAGIVLTLTDAWLGFALYWLAPMLLVLPLIMRIRSIAEHFALRHDHPLRQTRTVCAGWLERLLIAPHHIGLHIDHHLQASVPFYNLPKFHQLLMECEHFAANAHINDGYFVKSNRYPERALFAADLYGSGSVVLQPSSSANKNSAGVPAT